LPQIIYCRVACLYQVCRILPNIRVIWKRFGSKYLDWSGIVRTDYRTSPIFQFATFPPFNCEIALVFTHPVFYLTISVILSIGVVRDSKNYQFAYGLAIILRKPRGYIASYSVPTVTHIVKIDIYAVTGYSVRDNTVLALYRRDE